jgi:hypothetical protein
MYVCAENNRVHYYFFSISDYRPVDDGMEYILDYLDALQWEEQHAMPLSVEVDREMEEVADYIEASSWSPRRAMPADVEVDTEMEEVLDCIEAEQVRASQRSDH